MWDIPKNRKKASSFKLQASSYKLQVVRAT